MRIELIVTQDRDHHNDTKRNPRNDVRECYHNERECRFMVSFAGVVSTRSWHNMALSWSPHKYQYSTIDADGYNKWKEYQYTDEYQNIGDYTRVQGARIGEAHFPVVVVIG